MEIIQIVAVGLVSTILILVIREHRPELALQLSILVGIFILLVIISYLGKVISTITDLALRANVNLIFLETILRIIGVAYIAEFGAQICRDAGETSIAAKIELAAKVLILVMAIPIILSVMESILNFLP